jgi:hypothetical protein
LKYLILPGRLVSRVRDGNEPIRALRKGGRSRPPFPKTVVREKKLGIGERCIGKDERRMEHKYDLI